MRNHQPVASLLLVVGLCWSAAALTGKHGSTGKPDSSKDRVVKSSVDRSYGDVPLAFEPNQGQAPADVRFLARAQGMTVLLKNDVATLIAASSAGNRARIDMRFVGASFANQPYALDGQAGISNYLTGSTPDQWHTEIPNFGRVNYTGVYPGIDLVLYGNHRQLEHDFVVSPGADYHKIAVKLDGPTQLAVGENGELQVKTASGSFVFHAPVIYQYHGTEKVFIPGRYTLLAADEFSFQLGNFDRALPVVIDPTLSYSTYLAGSASDGGTAIKIDSNGNAYVTGFTASIDFPVNNPEQGTCSNICSWADAFVTKLNTTGTGLVYSTFVGGSNDDRGTGIAVDSLGNASVSGTTSSLDFPQKNGLSVVLNSNTSHGFILSLNPAGSALNFSSYLAGEWYDAATGVATDSAGNVYVAGTTSSAFFPLTPGHQIGPLPSLNFPGLFLAKFSRAGKLAFSSVIGGSSMSFPGTFIGPTPMGLAVDSAGEAVLSGGAFDGFPTTAGAFQPTYPGLGNTVSTFLTKLKSDGTAILYGTYLSGTGGLGGSNANALALDGSGNVYVTGTAYSSDFPTTPGSYQPSALSGQFISKLDPTLSTLIYSTYFGAGQFDGFGTTTTSGIAVDSHGDAFVTGATSQPMFPLVSPVMGTLPQGQFGSGSAAFLSVLDPSGSNLTFSTYFAGSNSTNGTAVAVGLSGNPYITGSTGDSDLPTTTGAFQRTIPVSTGFQQQHAFVTKFSMSSANPAACLSAGSIYFGTIQPGQSSLPIPLTLTNCGTLPLTVSSAKSSTANFVAAMSGCVTVAPGASCTIKVRYTPAIADGQDLATLTITDNAPVHTQTVLLVGYSTTPNLAVPGEITFPTGVVGVKGYPVFTTASSNSGLPVHISKVVISGSDFTLVNKCPAVVESGSNCNIGAVFTPKAAGARAGSIAVYDDAPGSPQVISLSGTAVASYPTPTLTFVNPGSAEIGSGPTPVLIQGTGIYPTSKFTLNGTAVTVTAHTNGFQITIPAALLTTMSTVSIQVVNPSPGGFSVPFNFVVFKHIALGAGDAVYEPFTRKFYASIPATDVTNPNALVTIDPVTFAKGTPIPIGNDPGALGLSTDGTILYVGLNGNNSIVPFNILTQKAGPEIPLGSDPQKLPLTAAGIEVQPDHPANLIAILNSGFYGRDGLDWIKNGKVVTQFLNEPPVNEAPFSGLFTTTNDFYAWSNNFNGNGFSHFIVSGNNLLEGPGFFEQLGLGPFDSDGKYFYSITGLKYAVSDGSVVGNFFAGQFPFNSAVLTEPNSGRTFFLGNQELTAFDSNTLAQVGDIPGLRTFQSSRFQHWGANGLSYLDSAFSASNDLYLFRTPLLYPAVGPNPLPVLTSVSPSLVASKGSNFLLTVTGSKFIRGAVVQWNGVTRTTKWVSATKLVADIQASEIKAAGTAKITVVNPGPGGGPSSSLSLTIQ